MFEPENRLPTNLSEPLPKMSVAYWAGAASAKASRPTSAAAAVLPAASINGLLSASEAASAVGAAVGLPPKILLPMPLITPPVSAPVRGSPPSTALDAAPEAAPRATCAAVPIPGAIRLIAKGRMSNRLNASGSPVSGFVVRCLPAMPAIILRACTSSGLTCISMLSPFRP